MTQTPPEAAEVYALGIDTEESSRLRRQADELRPQAVTLLAEIGLRPGHRAIDLGCGPLGILDLLAKATAPGGTVTGVDADPRHVRMAREFAASGGLGNVEVIHADARDTGLPGRSFDLVHARTLLVTIPDPAEVVAEMVRLTRPGGWVASQEPDCDIALCYPRSPAWDRLRDLFLVSFARSGADPLIGRRVAELYRAAGLTDIEVTAYAGVYPAGHSRRSLMPDLVRGLRPAIVELGLATEQELIDLDHQVRQHLADPDTISLGHLLFIVRGRKLAAGTD
jgi:ubiquinone/menaquinone biosynthesis C-methylase UbiE